MSSTEARRLWPQSTGLVEIWVSQDIWLGFDQKLNSVFINLTTDKPSFDDAITTEKLPRWH